MAAAMGGSVDCVNIILNHQIGRTTLHAKTEEGNTSLYMASHSGCLEVIETLLNAGVDRTIINRAGELPIDLCIQKGFTVAAKKLQVSEG